MCRAAYALGTCRCFEIFLSQHTRKSKTTGGFGSGFCNNDQEVRELCAKAFTSSPQILVEADIRGWKECEYEVVRDSKDNCITVCNRRILIPWDSTGESIVVAPRKPDKRRVHASQRCCHQNCETSRHCWSVPAQYALNPYSQQYSIIEVNPRLSRSSALASKATGYPLAFVAAKLGLALSFLRFRTV